jgi:CRP-like cAMP-binding protein
LIGTGLVLPIAAIVIAPLLRRTDEGGAADVRRVQLIRGEPLFAPLSLATVEYLAAALLPIDFQRDEWLMREGDPAGEYLLIESGDVEISQDGRAVGTVGPGGGVGEIALMQDVPRTASIRALGPVTAFSLGRAAFLEAVVGHATSRAAATSRVQARLAADSERPALH